MRVFVLVSDDVLFKPRALFRFLLLSPHEVCGVAEVGEKRPSKKKSAPKPGPRKISLLQYWGLRDYLIVGFISYALRVLSHLPLPTFVRSRLSNRNVCSFFGVPYTYVRDVNREDFISFLTAQSPDVIVSWQRQIFRERLLGVPHLVCLNCHPAKLPAYRGLNPIFSAMLNGETEMGVTVHTMTRKIDAGAIVSRRAFRVSRAHTLMDNFVVAHEFYADALIEALARVGSADLDGLPKIPEDAPYHPYPTVEDVTRFRQKGLRLV